MASIGENFPLIALLVALILLQFFLRRGMRKPVPTHGEIAQNLLAEVRLNQAILEFSKARQKPRKLELASWQRSRNNVDFLGQPLQGVLSDAFTGAEDFNHQIDAAKKYGSTSYLLDANLDRIKGLLIRSQEGLEEWLLKNVGHKELQTKYPSMFDMLFGGRR